MQHRHCRRVWVGLILMGIIIGGAGIVEAQNFEVVRLTDQIDLDPGPGVDLSNPLHLPVQVLTAPGDTTNLYVVQLGGSNGDRDDGDTITKQEGCVVLYNRETRLVDYDNPWLTISDTILINPVRDKTQVGLFSLAFHPNYATNGKFYVSAVVNYTNGQNPNIPGDPREEDSPFKTVVREYTVNLATNEVDYNSARTILELHQPWFNHNGSTLLFNPIETAQGKNYLYVSHGDGGQQNDSQNYGQNKNNWYGTILRVDIDGDDFPGDPLKNYAIPDTNPFVSGNPLGTSTTADDEVYAYGLRNPYRMGFDSATGDLYIGDVGQKAWEEIDYIPYEVNEVNGGQNFGWRLREGFDATPTNSVGGPQPPDGVDPIIALRYGSGDFRATAITGGIVYRGPIPQFQGMYFFADFFTSQIWMFNPDDIGSFDDDNPENYLTIMNSLFAPDVGSIDFITAFSEDENGNIIFVDISGELFLLKLR